MPAREALRVGLAVKLPLEEPVNLPVGDDIMLLLQAVDGDGHAEPNGIEHDERGRSRDVALAHASKARRFLPS